MSNLLSNCEPMLTKGNKSEAEERLNALMQRLSGLSLKPERWNHEEFSKILGELGILYEDLSDIETAQLVQKLIETGMNWQHLEIFADCLVRISIAQHLMEYQLKAKDIYEYIQNNSGTFSFQLMQKLNQLSN